MVVNALAVTSNNQSRYQFFGNGGFDALNLSTPAGTTLGVFQSGLQSGAVGGVPIPVDYFTTEAVNLAPGGGSNLNWYDVSNSIWGTASNPGAGFEFFPTGGASRLPADGGRGRHHAQLQQRDRLVRDERRPVLVEHRRRAERVRG